MARTGRWLLWSIYVTLWTVSLLVPRQVVNSALPSLELEEGLRLMIAKSIHAAAYAVLAILCAWLRLEARFRFLLVFFLMGHATLTEILQQYIEGRTGTLLDVAINDLGILAGIVLSWSWWVQKD